MGIMLLQQSEQRIIRCVVTELLDQGFTLSVLDEEGDFSVQNTRNYASVLNEIGLCDCETILVSHPDNKRVGTIELVYGNDGYDVISDLSCWVDEIIPKTNALIDQLERQAH